MEGTESYPFSSRGSPAGGADLFPLLPLTLRYGGRSATAAGLLDTGAAVNVLPFALGLELGMVWEEQTVPLQLTGNLALSEARAVLTAIVGGFAPVRLAFAWTRADEIPLILGQVNFFQEFDVCFYRSQRAFEVRPSAGRDHDRPDDSLLPSETISVDLE